MARKRQRKNDVFYAAVMLAMLAVISFNVAAEYFASSGPFAQVLRLIGPPVRA